MLIKQLSPLYLVLALAKMESDTQESPATIHSLPPELLSDILSHLFTTDEIHLDSLKHASLVSRAWRDPAQTLVWEAGAELRSSEDVERFIRTSSSRRSGPREMAIHDYEDAGQLKRLFAVCGSLRWLMVAVGHKNFDATVLTVPQLSSTPFSPLPLLSSPLIDSSFRPGRPAHLHRSSASLPSPSRPHFPLFPSHPRPRRPNFRLLPPRHPPHRLPTLRRRPSHSSVDRPSRLLLERAQIRRKGARSLYAAPITPRTRD